VLANEQADVDVIARPLADGFMSAAPSARFQPNRARPPDG
jgi:hypothetical protein